MALTEVEIRAKLACQFAIAGFAGMLANPDRRDLLRLDSEPRATMKQLWEAAFDMVDACPGDYLHLMCAEDRR